MIKYCFERFVVPVDHVLNFQFCLQNTHSGICLAQLSSELGLSITHMHSVNWIDRRRILVCLVWS